MDNGVVVIWTSSGSVKLRFLLILTGIRFLKPVFLLLLTVLNPTGGNLNEWFVMYL